MAVCADCKASFKKIGPACRHCAQPLPDEKFLLCGLCAKKQPAIDRTLTAYLYEDPLRTLLHDFKYKEALYLRSFLVDLMLEALPERTLLQTECLVPVPLHPKRIRQRGFNQAAELAKLLAKRLGLACDLDLCQKVLHTPPQASLDRQERQRNLRRAFQARTKGYQHITLVDDLLTTGSTANELAREFKKQGIVKIDLWCCARTA